MASLILFYHRILRSQSHCLKSINVSNVNLCYITELHELLIFVVLQANGDWPLASSWPSLPSSSSSQHKLALSQHRGKHSGMLAFRFFAFTKSQEDKIKRKEVPKAGRCASWTEQVLTATFRAIRAFRATRTVRAIRATRTTRAMRAISAIWATKVQRISGRTGRGRTSRTLRSCGVSSLCACGSPRGPWRWDFWPNF